METQKFQIISAQSKIDWVGRKVTGAHNGTIDIKKGDIEVVNGKVTGGNFIIDTTSIVILDIADPATNAQFAGHLASEDFFASEKFPEAYFNITSITLADAEQYEVKGDLTIRGITNTIKFIATVNVKDNILTVSGEAVVDRTKYDMKFRSGNFFTNLGDTLIYNEFELDIHLTAKAVTAAIAA
ncbi:MAG TPA: YceI family protein [Ohtaekwangia sp.]|uniref:YceI family protein n=1 Tax=Ohtaekwangia sp. TaxID=2066019 RepID=UPI002F93E75B